MTPTRASRIGHALRPVRAGLGAVAAARLGEGAITLASAAFDDGAPMHARFTADGAGLSPPLHWAGVPEGTASLALMVEDADAPLPRPIVHLVLHALSPSLNGLAEGAVPPRMAQSRMFVAGRNSYGRRGWLPPSPIPGHGPHRYVFQLFALPEPFAPRRVPGRGAVLVAARRGLLAHGTLVGTYERP